MFCSLCFYFFLNSREFFISQQNCETLLSTADWTAVQTERCNAPHLECSLLGFLVSCSLHHLIPNSNLTFVAVESIEKHAAHCYSCKGNRLCSFCRISSSSNLTTFNKTCVDGRIYCFKFLSKDSIWGLWQNYPNHLIYFPRYSYSFLKNTLEKIFYIHEAFAFMLRAFLVVSNTHTLLKQINTNTFCLGS